MLVEYSPSGKEVCQSAGPLNAKIVLIGESPAGEEMAEKPFPKPLVGPSGRLLNQALVKAGIDRDQCYVMNCVPIRAPGDKFANHTIDDKDWGLARLKSELASLSNAAKILVTLGANPTEWVLGGKPPVAQRSESGKREGFISAWRGSIIPSFGPYKSVPEDYVLQPAFANNITVIPTFHPAAVLRQFNWHPWFIADIAKAGEIAKNGMPATKYRKWHRNDPLALKRLADSNVDLISVDTEMSPWIVGIATDDEVHVFEFEEAFRHSLIKLMSNPKVVKIAHRWLHDHAFFRKCLDIDIKPPLFDVLGGMQNLNSALEKSLSPHLSTKFTNWPYHKWLTNVDQLQYCGMDCVVAYDAYWPMMRQLIDRGLYNAYSFASAADDTGLFVEPKETDSVTGHDHKLLMPLIAMQAKGFKIDEAVRIEVEQELGSKLFDQEYELSKLVEPVIQKNLKRFQKPHLFQVDRQCECCGGGTTQREHCMLCSLGETVDPSPLEAKARGFKSAKAFKASFTQCKVCNGTGKVIKKLEFNSDSPDQLADVIYRGLHIRPRKFKGKETVKAAQLNSLRDKHPIIAKVVDTSELRAEYDTIKRLSAGTDGLLHCEFDPWGAETRMASKEGLLEAGTNAQNLPKEARRFVVPRTGYTFLYPDFAQVEARAYAVVSGDINLRKALYEVIPDLGKPDYHTWLLRAITAYDGKIILSRDQSKRTSYAGFFGVRPEQLAKELTAEAFRKKAGMSVDVKQATTILDVLYKICPDIPRAHQAMCDEVLRTRRLKNPYTGREFPFVGYIVDKDNKTELDYEIKKQVYSRQVQDMGSWILGLGLIDLYYTSNEWGKLLTPLIPVHDSVLIECPSKKVTEASALAIKFLTRYLWGMDFPVDMKTGDNWYIASGGE